MATVWLLNFLSLAEAFVSLATNDDYAMGAVTLGRSLRDANTTKRLILLVTNGVTPSMRYNKVTPLQYKIISLEVSMVYYLQGFVAVNLG